MPASKHACQQASMHASRHKCMHASKHVCIQICREAEKRIIGNIEIGREKDKAGIYYERLLERGVANNLIYLYST